MKKSNKIKKMMTLIKGNRMFFFLVAMLILFNMVVVTSVAWFTLNRQTDANQMGMALAVDDTVALYKGYMYDLTQEKGTDQIMIDGKLTDLNIANIELNPYDTIFKGQNKYTPVFARIELVRSSSMPESGTVHVTVERNATSTTNPLMAEYSSSILRFTAFVISDNDDEAYKNGDLQYMYSDGTYDAEGLYNYINYELDLFNEVEDYTGHLANSKNFVSGTAKTDSLTLSVSYLDTDWYVRSNGDTVLNVYLYMTYDAALIAGYMNNKTGGDDMSLDDNTVSFANDLTRIRVSYTD